MIGDLSNRWCAGGRTMAEKARVLDRDVYYEIIMALGIPACSTSDNSAWEDVNYARLGHCRVLIDFFEKSGNDRDKKDDVISEDYCYPSEKFEFSEGVRDRLSKDLFHLTYSRLRYEGKWEDKPWPNEYLIEVHKRCIKFVMHLLQMKLPEGVMLINEGKWRQLGDGLNSGRELRVSHTDKDWKVDLGLPLESGYSRFTEAPVVTVSNEYAANTVMTVITTELTPQRGPNASEQSAPKNVPK